MDVSINYKKCYEYFLIPLLFFASFFNQALCWVFTVSLIPFLLMKEKGALKIILLVSIRCTINQFFAQYLSGNLGIVKWIILFACSIWILIFSCKKALKRKEIKVILFIFVVLMAYVVIQSLICSSYPLVSIAKYVSYSFVFFAIISCISQNANIDWIGYIFLIFSILFIVSAVFLFVPSIGYRRNGVGFQGVFNQPNMMGILCPLVLVCMLRRKTAKSFFVDIVFLIIILLFAYLSKSRTGIFAVSIILAIVFVTNRKMSIAVKFAFGGLCILLFTSVYFVSGYLQEMINSIIFKGGNSFLYSRSGQINNFLNKMEYNAFFGTGFLTPFVSDTKSFIFSFNLIVEDGNVFIATLGYVGIIGFTLFLILYGFIFISNKNKSDWVLFFLPIAISLGEMTFFSTNNLGCLFYVFYAVYMFSYHNGYNVDSLVLKTKEKYNDCISINGEMEV